MSNPDDIRTDVHGLSALAKTAYAVLGLAFVWFFLPAFGPDLYVLLRSWIPFAERLYPIDATTLVEPATRLRWLLALLPAGIIVHHAVFLRFVRVKQFPSKYSRPLSSNGDPMLLTPTSQARELYFGSSALLLRYGFPALMVVALTSTMLAALQAPASYVPAGLDAWPEWQSVLLGLRCGFAGAYLYVVITLAQRTFRRDVTSGVSMWSAAMLVLGPALAAAIAYVWPGMDEPGETMFTKNVVLIGAGMAPRQFAAFLQRGAARFTQTAVQATARKLTPLSEVHGISEDIEQRLAEEGIADAFTLAYCNPWFLMRSTSFDRRQIAAWVDEALLLVMVPAARKLQEHGITGAIDLAWYGWGSRTVNALATAAGVDANVLKDIAQRLSQDAQVRVVWTLYQTDSEGEPDPARRDGEIQRRIDAEHAEETRPDTGGTIPPAQNGHEATERTTSTVEQHH